MALGYTIATILKRCSHVFSDDKVYVKIDWLEQLNRKYVQVSTDYFICLFKLIWGLLH
jgi:uridine kinase